MVDRKALGDRAEEAAAAYFLESGCVLLGKNVRVGRLEIDLVVREDAVVAIVEVRLRGDGSWVRPMTSVDAGKRARIRAAGESLWRTRYRFDTTLERMRFDIASVRFDERGVAEIEHVRAAF
jgi:putative endonuclease